MYLVSLLLRTGVGEAGERGGRVGGEARNASGWWFQLIALVCPRPDTHLNHTPQARLLRASWMPAPVLLEIGIESRCAAYPDRT